MIVFLIFLVFGLVRIFDDHFHINLYFSNDVFNIFRALVVSFTVAIDLMEQTHFVGILDDLDLIHLSHKLQVLVEILIHHGDYFRLHFNVVFDVPQQVVEQVAAVNYIPSIRFLVVKVESREPLELLKLEFFILILLF
jgi:hypothetical protein